ncbi:MAG TPA: radical SAM family heme chaperone HemW [Planctomycetota bacterium]|nr:radical SAM family heme chaperone HemW [Planctomycetota bacterium]
MSDPESLYIHIPFCVHKCPYCGFYSVAGRSGIVPTYLAALRSELAAAPRSRPLKTIYVGGGTPTSMSADELRILMAIIDDLVRRDPDCEYTVEANPGTLDSRKIIVLKSGGVNRISLGAQSFNARILRKLGRIHGPEEIVRSVEVLRAAGMSNIGLDLMFAIPGQTHAQWHESIDAALELAPRHVSAYGLSFDDGTVFQKRLHEGKIRTFTETGYLRMYSEVRARLREAGFAHYEISNFARPGFESRHNCNYWLNGSYLGIGASATAFVNGERRTNVSDVGEYIRRISECGSAAVFSERLPPDQFARETAAFNIRYLPGIERESFRERTGFDIEDLFAGVIERFTPRFLSYENGVLRLTDEAVACADTISAEFLGDRR